MDCVDDNQFIPTSDTIVTDTRSVFTTAGQKDCEDIDIQGKSFSARQKDNINIGIQEEAFCEGQEDIQNVDAQDGSLCARQNDIRYVDIQDELFWVRQKENQSIDTQEEPLSIKQHGIINIDTQEEHLSIRQQDIRNIDIQCEHLIVRQNDVLETERQDEHSSAGNQTSFPDKLVITVDESNEASQMRREQISRQKSPRQLLPRRRCHTVDVLSTDDGYEASMEELERETSSDTENPRLTASPGSADITPLLKGGNSDPATDAGEFRYSLLEDVLMQKKLALLKSVEVKQFLREQQAQVFAAVSSTSPNHTGSASAVNDSSVMDNG